MNSSFLVSIIIPCYNQGLFIREAIKSVLKNSVKSLQIVVVNDGSTDPFTIDVLKDLETNKICDLTIVNQANKGLSSARNAGLEFVTGEFIQFLDADDVLLEGKLDFQLEAFKAHEQASIVLCDYFVSDKNLSKLKKPLVSTVAGYSYDLKTFITCWEKGLSIPIHCGLFRRSIFDRISFDDSFKGKEDWIFWCSVLADPRGFKFFFDSKALVVYRIHSRGMTSSRQELMLQEWFRAQGYLLWKYSLSFSAVEAREVVASNYEHLKKVYLKNLYPRNFYLKNALKAALRHVGVSV